MTPTLAISSADAGAAPPTVWGLSPTQLHDRFWASRGVQVVRRGEPSEIVESAELFLLTDPHSLVIFRLRELVEVLSWLNPRLVVVRLRDEGGGTYREVVKKDEEGRFVEFDRIYDGVDSRHARVGLTPDREVARRWQAAGGAAEGWKLLRREIPADVRHSRSMPGRVFDPRQGEQLVAHLECLMRAWAHPDSTVPRARSCAGGAG